MNKFKITTFSSIAAVAFLYNINSYADSWLNYITNTSNENIVVGGKVIPKISNGDTPKPTWINMQTPSGGVIYIFSDSKSKPKVLGIIHDTGTLYDYGDLDPFNAFSFTLENVGNTNQLHTYFLGATYVPLDPIAPKFYGFSVVFSNNDLTMSSANMKGRNLTEESVRACEGTASGNSFSCSANIPVSVG